MKSCFVIGPVKSGTTLLISLLDSHPELALFPMEVKLFTHWIEKFADNKTLKLNKSKAAALALEKEKANVSIKGDLVKQAFITSSMGVSYRLKLGKSL